MIEGKPLHFDYIWLNFVPICLITICQHRFRQCIGVKQATNHYDNQWGPRSLKHTENEFENVGCNMSAISSRPQCVKDATTLQIKSVNESKRPLCNSLSTCSTFINGSVLIHVLYIKCVNKGDKFQSNFHRVFCNPYCTRDIQLSLIKTRYNISQSGVQHCNNFKRHGCKQNWKPNISIKPPQS